MVIPLEDTFSDVISKSQRGRKLSDADLASLAGVSEPDLAEARNGVFNPLVIRKLAPVLALNTEALVALGSNIYQPAQISLHGLEIFNTPFDNMTVNSYLVWDASSKEAVAFDTGADATAMLDFLGRHGLSLKLLLLTHTHLDHVFELDRLVEQTRAPAFAGDREPALKGARPFAAGKQFQAGSLAIETRLTWGHSQGGITYLVHGLEKPLAVVGDAMFAGSMGGGGVSYTDALRTNREEIMTLPDATVIAPGHGPLTTVGEQKKSNPFLAL